MINLRRNTTVDDVCGFTIFEIIMVISIISILAITAYPLLTAPSEIPLDAAAKVVESDINLTQIKAMTSGTTRSIIFSGGKSKYYYESENNTAGGFSRDLGELSSSIKIGADVIITFNSLGEPLGQGQNKVIILSQRTQKMVTVEPYIGKTKIE